VIAAVVALVVVIGAVVGIVLATGGDDDGSAGPTTREPTRRTLNTRGTTDTEFPTISLDDTTTFDTSITGDTLAPDAISVFSLFAGLCFDDPSGGTGTISVVYERACTSPHDGEVYAFYDFPNPLGDAYPGDESVENTSNTECRNRFTDYTGKDVDTSPFTLFWLSPNAESWSTGDREVACYVRDANSETGAKLMAPIVP
jgi:hypothetical protein